MMDLAEEEVYVFTAILRVYDSLIGAVTGFTFPKKIFTTDIVVVLLKTLLLNPGDEENYLTAPARTEYAFRKRPIACETPLTCEPWTSVFLADLYLREVQHK